MIEPFTARIPQAEVDDLQHRLAMTRWAPEQPPGTEDGAYGVPLSRLRRLVSHWEKFDWRRWEGRLNAYPQFRTESTGSRCTSSTSVRRAGALPLVLSHGWPGSVFEYMELIDRLTDPVAHGGEPGDAFDVVLPSLPGYGFSGPACARLGDPADRRRLGRADGQPRLQPLRRDRQRRRLDDLARARPTGARAGGGRTRHPAVQLPRRRPGRAGGPGRRRAGAMEVLGWFWQHKGAFNALQGQQPQTLAHALADSPAGLSAGTASCSTRPSTTSSCSPTSPSTGSPGPPARRSGTTTRTPTPPRRRHPARPPCRSGSPPRPTAISARSAGSPPRPRQHHLLARAARRDRPLQRLHQPDQLAADIRRFFRPLRPAAPPDPPTRRYHHADGPSSPSPSTFSRPAPAVTDATGRRQRPAPSGTHPGPAAAAATSSPGRRRSEPGPVPPRTRSSPPGSSTAASVTSSSRPWPRPGRPGHR